MEQIPFKRMKIHISGSDLIRVSENQNHSEFYVEFADHDNEFCFVLGLESFEFLRNKLTRKVVAAKAYHQRREGKYDKIK